MTGMKRSVMLAGRKCGLKYYDKAVALVGQQAIIDKAILYHIGWPERALRPIETGGGWSCFDWAFGNAVKDIIASNKEISQTYNLMDVLQAQDVIYIQSKAGLIGNPPDVWEHK